MKTATKYGIQQTFETERLLIRPWRLDDLEDCLAMDRDPEVTRFFSGPVGDPEKHRAFLLESMQTHRREGFGYWSIFEKSRPDEFLGWIMLVHPDDDLEAARIDLRLRKQFWRQGYGTEAYYAIQDNSFSKIEISSMEVDIDVRNTAAIRLAESVGMSYEEERSEDGQAFRSYMICASELY